jgi:SSS family solute:Na+ symporter
MLLLAGISTVVYTAIGGMRSNIYADAVSFVVMSLVLAVIVPLIMADHRIMFAALPVGHLNPTAFGGMSFLLLSVLLSVVSSFMFMELWQRIFAAESAGTAKRAFLLSAVLQPPFIISAMLLGLAAATLYPGIDKGTAIFRVMFAFLPSGLLGLGMVAIFAILMSTVTSLVLVGGSTLYTDIFRLKGKEVTGHASLRHVRVLTLLFGVAALLMAFLVADLVKLLLMGAFFMIPMCPAIIWALFGQKFSAGAAASSMIVGLIVTVSLMGAMPQTAFGPGFLASLIVLLVGHYFTPNNAKHNQII